MLLYWLFACQAALAQRLHFYGLDVTDGLSQKTIWSTAQTAGGYLWFVAADGVGCYCHWCESLRRLQLQKLQHQQFKRLSLPPCVKPYAPLGRRP
jgi:ligand-binding sensor domain-containing protein